MIIGAIIELAQYAEQHGLDAIHRALSLAIDRIQDTRRSERKDFETDDVHWFGSALDLLIAHARRFGWTEVLDHLLEAKMAWDERPDERPDGNIIEFRNRNSTPRR